MFVISYKQLNLGTLKATHINNLRHGESLTNSNIKNLFSKDKSSCFVLPASPLGAFSTYTTRCDDRAARGRGCVLPRRTNRRQADQARSWRHISGDLSSMRYSVQDVLPARKRRVRTVFLAVAPADHRDHKRADKWIGRHRLTHRDSLYKDSHVRGQRLTGTVGQESAAWAADWSAN